MSFGMRAQYSVPSEEAWGIASSISDGGVEHDHLVIQPDILPPQQRDRNVSVLQNVIVKLAQAEFISPRLPSVGQKFRNLQLADLICDGLSGQGSEEDGFGPRGFIIHRRFSLQVLRRLINTEDPQRQLDVNFDPQSAQPHEVVDGLARTWAVVKQPGLERHFFGVKADALVRPRIVVVATNRIFMRP